MATGKRLSSILMEQHLWGSIPPEMMDLMKRAVNMREHLAANKRDTHITLRLSRVESKIWRLARYYMGRGVLPKDWRYDPQQAALLIRGKA